MPVSQAWLSIPDLCAPVWGRFPWETWGNHFDLGRYGETKGDVPAVFLAPLIMLWPLISPHGQWGADVCKFVFTLRGPAGSIKSNGGGHASQAGALTRQSPPSPGAASGGGALIKLHKRKERNLASFISPRRQKKKCSHVERAAGDRKQDVLAVTLQYFWTCLSFDCSEVEKL